MKIAIHQPHYYPWIGYFDKIAKADVFVLLTEVQLTDSSYMHRNRFIDVNGNIKYVTIPFNKKEYAKIAYNKLKINNSIAWQTRNANFIKETYKKAPFFNEVWDLIAHQFTTKYEHLNDLVCESIFLLCRILDIKTKVNFQENIEYDRHMQKSQLVMGICKAMKADIYLSGKGGSINYLNFDEFENNKIKIEFQNISAPYYKQINTNDFIGGISILDMLFNCGIEETKRIFWENVNEE